MAQKKSLKSRLSGFFTDLAESLRLYPLEWLACLFVMMIYYGVFYYYDFSDTLDNSIMLIESIMNNCFSDYYHYAIVNAHPRTVYTANYNIILYGLFAVWNLPVAFLHINNGLDYMTSGFALLWCKLLIVASLFAIVFVIRKIVLLFTDDHHMGAMAQIVFISCSCTLVPALAASQYDSLSLVFMLLGIYWLIKGNEKLFLFMFMLASPLKLFSLFVFIPLLLLKEKRIPFIVAKLLAVFSLNILCGLPFRNDPYYKMCMSSQNRDAIDLLLKANITIADIPLNIFAACFIALCVYCYVTEYKDSTDYLPVWVSLGAIAPFILFVPIRSYWVILIVPFAVLTIFASRRYYRANMLLFVISTACYSVYALMNHRVHSIPEFTSTLLLNKFIDFPAELKYGTIRVFFSYHFLTKYKYLLYSVFVIAMVLIVIINSPYKSLADKKENNKPERFTVWMQIAVSFVLAATIIYATTAPRPEYVCNTTGTAEPMAENVFSHIIEQDITTPEGENSFKVKELIFTASGLNNSRQIRNTVSFTLIDCENGRVVFNEIVGVPLIYNDTIYTIKLDGVELLPAHQYTLKIEGHNLRGESTLYLYRNVEYDDDSLRVDGNPVRGKLAFTLE